MCLLYSIIQLKKERGAIRLKKESHPTIVYASCSIEGKEKKRGRVRSRGSSVEKKRKIVRPREENPKFGTTSSTSESVPRSRRTREKKKRTKSRPINLAVHFPATVQFSRPRSSSSPSSSRLGESKTRPFETVPLLSLVRSLARSRIDTCLPVCPRLPVL